MTTATLTTTDTINATEFANLDHDEAVMLRTTLLGIAASGKKKLVEVRYHKVGKGKVRIAERDFAPIHEDTQVHVGNLGVGVNKKGELYLTLEDYSRATENKTFGYTNMKPEGVIGFKVVNNSSLS